MSAYCRSEVMCGGASSSRQSRESVATESDATATEYSDNWWNSNFSSKSSLLRLFESKLFDTSMAIMYLFNMKESGIQSYIGIHLKQHNPLIVMILLTSKSWFYSKEKLILKIVSKFLSILLSVS